MRVFREFFLNQGCEFGSAWIRIQFPSWFRILIQNADPDPGEENRRKKTRKKCKEIVNTVIVIL